MTVVPAVKLQSNGPKEVPRGGSLSAASSGSRTPPAASDIHQYSPPAALLYYPAAAAGDAQAAEARECAVHAELGGDLVLAPLDTGSLGAQEQRARALASQPTAPRSLRVY